MPKTKFHPCKLAKKGLDAGFRDLFVTMVDRK